VNLEMANLFGADPFRIPGHINLCDPAISIQPVGAGVSNHAAQQRGFVLQRLRGFAMARGEGEGETTLRCEQNVSRGMFTHGREAFSIGLHFHFVGFELPRSVNGAADVGAGGERLDGTQGCKLNIGGFQSLL